MIPPQPPASSGFNSDGECACPTLHGGAQSPQHSMLLFFYKINSSFILFTIILFAADHHADGQKLCFLQ
jgi:hypothetical protein